jgi:hypothetical protein
MLSRLTRTGLRKGLIDGSRPWLFVGTTVAAIRIVRRFTRKEPEVVFCGEIKPGQALVIKHAGAEPEIIYE